MRLNKFLATAGIASRRKCDDIILSGEVKVNGTKVTELGKQIDESEDKVVYQGKLLQLPTAFLYYKLNKPKGCLCTSSDDRGRKTIFDIVKIPNVRLFCIGRLDYDTEGLLLLTNDGDFSQNLIHPSFDVEKEYQCTVKGDLKESELAVLRAGVMEKGIRMPKATVQLLSIIKDEKGTKTKLSVKIKEGQNRQIRRMFEAIGREIVLLKRVAIGKIKLGGLSRGEYKILTEEEKECIGLPI